MHIHFVCTGNTNRSRMAEAYLRSKQLPGLETSSSGTRATANSNGHLCESAHMILLEEKLLSFTSASWTQTTVEILQKADIVIFMQKHHYKTVLSELSYEAPRYEVWGIGDVTNFKGIVSMFIRKKHLREDKSIFNQIVKKVDDLVLRLGY